MSEKVAALYVAKGGCYFDMDGVDPWDMARDARLYDGPWPVVAHPPCARWGRYSDGGPQWRKDGNQPNLVKLIGEHRGDFCEVNPLDGKEHNYLELGGWLGDQQLALLFIGLCDLLGVGKCLSPDTVMPFLDADTRQMMAQSGMVAMQAQS